LKVQLKTNSGYYTNSPYVETNYPDSLILEIAGTQVEIVPASGGFDLICAEKLFNLTPITGGRLRIKLGIDAGDVP